MALCNTKIFQTYFDTFPGAKKNSEMTVGDNSIALEDNYEKITQELKKILGHLVIYLLNTYKSKRALGDLISFDKLLPDTIYH